MQEKFKDFQILHGREEKVNPKLTAYQVELAQVEAEIEKLLDMLTGANATLLAYANKKIEELDTRRQTISKAIAELSVETISPQQIKKLSYYLDNWDSIDFDDKRKAADGLISTIKATSDRVQIEWKIWHFRSIAPHFYFILFVPLVHWCFGVFRVFSNVKRINKKKIADEKSDVLGDIDVLIIDEKKHRIVVAEVKNFDFSKNPYEIQAEYQKMFVDGKKKSFATKHKRRVEWVIAHFDDVRAQYSLPRNKWTVHGVFITNEPLMSVNTYRKKLSVLSEAELSVESLRKIQ